MPRIALPLTGDNKRSGRFIDQRAGRTHEPGCGRSASATHAVLTGNPPSTAPTTTA
ncbi:MAG TPA: hypothetical protein VFY22_09790 [Hydrogenophaga sp.]|nr:hypothetical protein [Hydrogenophaga sp.]